jgi:hypothetical protein
VEIRRITDIAEVMRCLPYEREVRKKHRDNSRESQLLLFVQSQLENPYFGFFIAYNDKNEILGYSVAFVSIIKGLGNRIHLSRLYAKKKDVFDALCNEMREWIRPLNIKTVQITATGHIKAFQRRYKFTPVSVAMERRI